jgi:hypothetical protein
MLRFLLDVALVAVVNFQVSVLKILAGYPTGLATLRELKRDLALLVTSGQDWSDLTRRLAVEFPQLDIFTLGFVERYSFGWRLTRKGLMALEMMEKKAKAALTGRPAAVDEPPSSETTPAEAPMFALAVGASAIYPAAITVSPRSPALSPIERRSQFAVIPGGRS